MGTMSGTVGNGGLVGKIGVSVATSGGVVPVAAEVGTVVAPDATVGVGVMRGVGDQTRVEDADADGMGLAGLVTVPTGELFVIVATGVRRLACNVDIRSCGLFVAGRSAINCSISFSSKGGMRKPFQPEP